MNQYNRIRIDVISHQAHINSRAKTLTYPMNQINSALKDLQDELIILNWDEEYMPSKIVDNDFFCCSEYNVLITFYNEFHIIESRVSNAEMLFEIFPSEHDAVQAFEEKLEEIDSFVKSFGKNDSIKDLLLFVNHKIYIGFDHDPHEVINDTKLVNTYMISENEGNLSITKAFKGEEL